MTASDFALILDDALFCNEDQRSDFFQLEKSNEEDDDELARLLLKEKDTHARIGLQEEDDDLDRSKAVEWLLKLNYYFDFSPLTCVLAVDYYDRFVETTLRFNTTGDKQSSPWMPHLLAVACLSLAAKMEEVQVPLLLDLQLEESTYMFEAKTVQRMELLILSTLKWKMNPVTPICYFNNILNRTPFKSNLHWEFLLQCERLLLSAISDSRYKHYTPSVLATSIMQQVIHEIEPCNYSTELLNQLMDVLVLKLHKEEVDECCKFLVELLSNDVLVREQARKLRYKYKSAPSSPSTVINVSFSYENSNDIWTASSEPPFKRSRAQDQLMRLH